MITEGNVKLIQESTNAALIQTNDEKIALIIKIVIVCGRQNAALRVHSTALEYGNKGNFHALLEFRAEEVDANLKEHLLHGTYTHQ